MQFLPFAEPNVVPVSEEETRFLVGWFSSFIPTPVEEDVSQDVKDGEDDSMMEAFLELSAEQQDMVLTR